MTMTINGSGTINGLTAGGLPNQTVTQEDLAPNTVGNGPAFSAYSTIQVTVPSGSSAKILFSNEEFDTDAAYDPITSRFQPKVPGYYMVSGATSWASPSSVAFVAIVKNGLTYKRGAMSGNTAGFYINTVSAIVYLNGTTDYVEIFAAQASGASVNTGMGSDVSYFQAHMVRSA